MYIDKRNSLKIIPYRVSNVLIVLSLTPFGNYLKKAYFKGYQIGTLHLVNVAGFLKGAFAHVCCFAMLCLLS